MMMEKTKRFVDLTDLLIFALNSFDQLKCRIVLYVSNFIEEILLLQI